jgi:hypothetical protein
MKSKGRMAGINVNFILRPPQGNYLNTQFVDMYRLDSRFEYGKINYYGGIQHGDGSVTPETFDGIDDYMAEVRLLFGKDFNFNARSTRVTPYLGGGYRYLFDASSKNKPGGYNRRIQYLYLPTGLEVMHKLGNGWSFGADAEYDFFIRGFVTSYLQTLGYGDLNNTQRGGFGLRGSIKLVKSFDRYSLFLEPYVRYWHIHNTRWSESKPNADGYVIIGEEPDNSSLEMGGKLGVEF